MSDSQGHEAVRVASEGVTVTKRFEEDEFPVPAIAFEFASEREQTVSVTLTDDVPESVAVEDLGFHPEYGSEYWAIDEEEITFERDFDADTEYTTVYGIRAAGADDVEKFLTDPAIEAVDPPLDEEAGDGEGDGSDNGAEDIVPESDDDIVKDVISGEGAVPGLEDDGVTDEEIETLDLKDPNAPNEETTVTTATTAGTTDPASTDDAAETDGTDDTDDADAGDGDDTGEDDADADADDSETAPVAADSVVAAMATEIREDEVSMDDLKLVQRAIDKLSDRSSADSANGAHDARVEKLQSDVADLRAYTDALEAFLEEEGTGDQLIRGFESRLEEFDQSLDRVQSDLSEATETVSTVRSEMDDVTDDVERMDTELGTVSEDLDEIAGSVSDLEASLDSLDSTVGELEDEVTDSDVAGRMDELEEDLQDLKEWQEQIRSTFGG